MNDFHTFYKIFIIKSLLIFLGLKSFYEFHMVGTEFECRASGCCEILDESLYQ